MSTFVLIVTPNRGFGGLIQQTLEDEGDYRIVIYDNGANALARARQDSFDLAILDADVEDITLLELGERLQQLFPQMATIVIPPDDNFHHPSVVPLSPNGYLTKPFYLPDLIGIVEAALRGESVPPPVTELEADWTDEAQETEKLEPETEPTVSEDDTEAEETAESYFEDSGLPWLRDNDLAAQYLTRLSLESAAQASLIVLGEKLWAYAGELSQPAAQELTEAISTIWESDGGSDCARFIRLESTGKEYMLYATGFTEDGVLAMAFDAGTPFGKIRTQAIQIAQSLSAPPPELSEPENNWMPESDLKEEKPPMTPSNESPQKEIQGNGVRDSQSKDSPSEARRVSSKDAPTGRAPSNQAPKLKREVEFVFPDLDLEEPMKEELSENDPQQLSSTKRDWLKSPLEWQQETSTEAETFNVPLIIPLPAQAKEQVAAMELESASNVLYHLTYACVLVPKFPKHEISGKLADHLNEWLPQICVAFGWRLESIDIRPDYIQWVVTVPPNTAPGAMIREIRRITSQRIFTELPWYERENPSGDFWTSGFIVVNHTEILPQQVIAAYVRQTRKRQGLAESNG